MNISQTDALQDQSLADGLPLLIPSMARPSEAAARAMQQLLLISYAFPPTGGGGVQRAVKFAKYLPHCGWRPTILTVENPSVPVQDFDFSRDLDPQNRVIRARTWEPSYGLKHRVVRAGHQRRGMKTALAAWLRRAAMRLLQPDPQILWNPSAYRAAARLLNDRARKSHLPQAILVTGPPFSSFLLGVKLKRQFGLPLILDFRDEWLLASRYLDNYRHIGAIAMSQQASLAKVLRAADAVIATTQASAAELDRSCRQVGSTATTTCIYNGFDPDDLSDLRGAAKSSPATKDPSKLRIVYTGTLWRLTDIGPLVTALKQLQLCDPATAAHIELIIAGRRTPEQDDALAPLRTTSVTLTLRDYIPHRESLKLASTADILLLLLADEPGAERVVPAKLFEYMALRLPILFIGPTGETHQLVAAHASTQCFAPREHQAIADWIAARLTDNQRPLPLAAISAADGDNRFSRPHLAMQLADVLNHCSRREPAHGIHR